MFLLQNFCFSAGWYRVVKRRAPVHAKNRNPLLKSYKRSLVIIPVVTSALPTSLCQKDKVSVGQYVSGFASSATITLNDSPRELTRLPEFNKECIPD